MTLTPPRAIAPVGERPPCKRRPPRYVTPSTSCSTPGELACGVTAHLVDPSNIDRGNAFRLDRHDRVAGARHTGWYANVTQFETLTGVVYAFAPDVDGDDEPVTTYHALAVSDDTDCHYLDPIAYDDGVAAAHAADRMASMAELVAGLEFKCGQLRHQAANARRRLDDANRMRGEALGILRHVRRCPADGQSLGPAFDRLCALSESGRRDAFRLIGERRPAPRRRPFDPKRTPTPAECRADAWHDAGTEA